MIIGKGFDKGNKKGELTSTQLILLILAIAGFVVILLFIFAFSKGNYTGDDACHLSVLTRATAPNAVNDYVPLKCTTKKTCLTDGKGKCESSFAGENPEVIKLPTNGNDAAAKIEETSAKAMYDCWSMMGQGKLDLFNGGLGTVTGFLNKKEVSCVICSRIAYNTKDTTLNNVNLPYYLSHTKIPGSSLTYMQTFTDSGISSYAGANTEDLKIIQADPKIISIEAGDSSSQSVKELAVVFTQIKVPSYEDQLKKLAKTGIIVTGTSFLMAPTTTLRAVVGIATSLPAVIVTGIAAGGVVAYSMAGVYQGKVAAAGSCDKFTTSKTASEEGCSSVQIVPYDVKTINTICGVIEGNP